MSQLMFLGTRVTEAICVADQLPSIISHHQFHGLLHLPRHLHPPQPPGLVRAFVFFDEFVPWANSSLELRQKDTVCSMRQLINQQAMSRFTTTCFLRSILHGLPPFKVYFKGE